MHFFAGGFIDLTMKLSELKCGERGKIIGFSADERLKSRLLSIGLGEGEKIKVVKFSLRSGAMICEANGRLYALRKEAAELIEVRV